MITQDKAQRLLQENNQLRDDNVHLKEANATLLASIARLEERVRVLSAPQSDPLPITVEEMSQCGTR